MAAPVIESFSEAASSPSVPSVTLTKPTGTASGDLLAAVIISTTQTNSLSGWAKPLALVHPSAGTINLNVHWILAGASEPSSYTFNFASNGRHTSALLRISGADATTPIRAATGSTPATNDTAPVCPSVTATADDLLLAIAALGYGDGEPFTEPSGMSLVCSGDLDSPSAFRNSSAIASETAAGGATGTRTFATGVAGFWATASIAIAPAAGGGGTDVEITAPVASVAVAGLAPSVASGSSVSVPSASLAVAAHAPTISLGAIVSVPAAGLTLAALAPSVAAGASITVPVANVAVAASAPSVSGGVSVAVPLANTTLAALAPVVAGGASVSVPAASVTVSAFAPAIASGTSIAVPAATVTVAGLAPSIIVEFEGIAVPTASIAVSTLAPGIVTGVAVLIPAANIIFGAFVPVIGENDNTGGNWWLIPNRRRGRR